MRMKPGLFLEEPVSHSNKHDSLDLILHIFYTFFYISDQYSSRNETDLKTTHFLFIFPFHPKNLVNRYPDKG
jgi:hypothetical protein